MVTEEHRADLVSAIREKLYHRCTVAERAWLIREGIVEKYWFVEVALVPMSAIRQGDHLTYEPDLKDWRTACILDLDTGTFLKGKALSLRIDKRQPKSPPTIDRFEVETDGTVSMTLPKASRQAGTDDRFLRDPLFDVKSEPDAPQRS